MKGRRPRQTQPCNHFLWLTYKKAPPPSHPKDPGPTRLVLSQPLALSVSSLRHPDLRKKGWVGVQAWKDQRGLASCNVSRGVLCVVLGHLNASGSLTHKKRGDLSAGPPLHESGTRFLFSSEAGAVICIFLWPHHSQATWLRTGRGRISTLKGLLHRARDLSSHM